MDVWGGLEEMMKIPRKYNTPDKRLLALATIMRKLTRLSDGDRKLLAEVLTEIAECLTTEAIILRANRVASKK